MFLEIDGFSCGGETVLTVIKFVMILLDVVFFVIPIILILMLSVDFVKNVVANREDDMKKNVGIAIKRLLMCVCLFLVSPVINFSIGLLGDLGFDYATCIEIARNDDLSQYELDLIPETPYNPISVDLDGPSGLQPSISDDDETSDSSGTVTQVGTFDIENKKDLVGIMYSTWFDEILPLNPQIISKTSNFVKNKYYFWGEPALGFYKSSDKTVIREHMQQLYSAGVDFIILDNTNMNPNVGYKKGSASWSGYVTNPMTALLDTIVEMRKNNQGTPYVVNWIYTGNNAQNGSVPFVTWESVNSIYDEFYTKEKYADVWVYWNGKPFILTTSTPTSSSDRKITTRSMWGLNGVSSVNWSYLEPDNDKPGKDSNGNIEQIGVSTAMQTSYMSNTSTAVGRQDGNTFYRQWQVAFKYHPKIVTITWWNEWGALFLGNGRFTDLYNQEYSRDIEPMKGGHGDTYYQWMKQYISAYKSNKDCPKLVGD